MHGNANMKSTLRLLLRHSQMQWKVMSGLLKKNMSNLCLSRKDYQYCAAPYLKSTLQRLLLRHSQMQWKVMSGR